MRGLSLVFLSLCLLPGRAGEPVLREAAEREHLREATDLRRVRTLTLRVRDEKGRPAAGLAVEAQTAQLEFSVGALVPPGFPRPEDEPNWAFFRGTFNRAYLEDGLRWRQWDPPDEVQSNRLREGLFRLRSAGIPVLGNALVWPGWHRRNPTGLRELADADLRSRIRAHVTRLAGEMRGLVFAWDVVHQPRLDRDFAERLGEAEGAAWFAAAEAAAPGTPLGFAEFALLNASEESLADVEARLAAWTRAGAKPSALRIHATALPPSSWPLVQANLDRLQRTGLRLEITHVGPAPGATEDEASDWRGLVALLLRHPAVKALYLGSGWEAPGSTQRQLADDLALRCETRELGRTDARGEWTLRLPRGEALVTIPHPDGPRLYKAADQQAELVVHLPAPVAGVAMPAPAPPPVGLLPPKPPAVAPGNPQVRAVPPTQQRPPSAARARMEAQWKRDHPSPPAGPLNLDQPPVPTGR